MRIYLQIHNTNTGDKIFEASAPDIDSAIAELGRYERIMETGATCLYCGEPVDELEKFCNEYCSLEHHNQYSPDDYDNNTNFHI